ncbi:MAG: SGNH/GDSL hydrolase family protein [Clostridia bacterium]|nr:SGNH/GDSL hydrolase family protein [Clostridia bacterium]MBR5880399.1 SGNH/GDSL hydrolase family protein [Clostridia bacterium]
MKILFQGDSVTDAGRDRSQSSDMGFGYPKYASAMLEDAFPDIDFAFTNLGISGNRTEDLVARMQSDFIEIQPDIVSIMIGINDVWHHYAFTNIYTSNEAFENNYVTLLEEIKQKTDAKIMIIQPFLISVPDKTELEAELAEKQEIVARLAEKYADVYLPMHDIFLADDAEDKTVYAADGVHPTEDGACLIAQKYLEAISPLVEVLADVK